MALLTITDPSIKIQVSSELKEHILHTFTDNSYDVNKDIPPSNIKNILKMKATDECHLTVSDLKWLYPRLSSDVKCKMYKILENCSILLPEPGILPRNPELEARIEKLKASQDEKQYKSMTKNVDSGRVKHPEDTIASQMKEINRQMIAVLQIVVSVSAGFAFGFMGIEYIVGTMKTDTRILIGLFCAFVIGIAELYFLLKNLEYGSPITNDIADDAKKKSFKNDLHKD